MSEFGSFGVSGGVLQRSPNFIDFVVKHREGTTALRLWVATNIEDAYGDLQGSGLNGSGGTVLLEAPVTHVGAVAQTARVEARKWVVEESRRGTTSFQFAAADVPALDDQFLFVRLQEQRNWVWQESPADAPTNPLKPLLGPICVLPPISYYTTPGAVFNLPATAPTGTGCKAGELPVLDDTLDDVPPLHLSLPRPAVVTSIVNTSNSEGLLVSLGLGIPMIEIAAGERYTLTQQGAAGIAVKDVVLASATAQVCPFVIDAAFQVL